MTVIEDKVQRINIKSKRKRTLIRKAIEVSRLCDLDVLVVIRDRETKKIIEYNSGQFKDDTTSLKDLFNLTEAIQSKSSGQFQSIVYNDSSYEQLLASKGKKEAVAALGKNAVDNTKTLVSGPLYTNNSLLAQKFETRF